MASTINASNSGFGGIVSTGDSSGQLQLQSAGTTAVTIDTSQNITLAKNMVLNGSTSGSITVAAPAVAGSNTLTLPASTGTVMINGPTFSARPSGVQSIPNLTWTKLSFQTEEWDTANCFDNVTNFRFTPNIAGYYQVNGGVQWSGATFTGENGIQFYKNGTGWKTTQDLNSAAYGISGSCLVYLNGSTDYVEMYVIQGSGGAKNTYAGAESTFFQAAMIRGA